jgi:peptide chain release factor 1
LYKLDDILNGDLTPVIEPLMREYNADLLAEMGRDDYQ